MLSRCIILLLCALCFALSVEMQGQSMLIQSLNSTNYPQIQARIAGFDSLDRPVSLSQFTDAIIQEQSGNSIVRPVASIDCTPRTYVSTSSLFMISSSSKEIHSVMRQSIKTWIESAHEYANTLSAQYTSENSLCSFGEFPIIHQDFTTDTSTLLAVSNTIQPHYGFQLNSAFADPSCGAFSILSRGRFRRVLVMVTDGGSNGISLNDSLIITQAERLGAMIHILTISSLDDKQLRRIAERSGGFYLNGIQPSQLSQYFKQLSSISHGATVCTYSWVSQLPPCSKERTYTFRATSLRSTAVSTIRAVAKSMIDDSLLASLRSIGSDSIALYSFGVVNANQEVIVTIPIVAGIQPVRITSITSSNPRFRIQNLPSLPYVLPKNGRIGIDIAYQSPFDSAEVSRIVVNSNACIVQQIICTANAERVDRISPQSTPTILNPKAGEQYYALQQIPIKWLADIPSDSVVIQYAMSSSLQWSTITSGASGSTGSGNVYQWTLPDTSGNVLLRIRYKQNNRWSTMQGDFSVLRSMFSSPSLICDSTITNQSSLTSFTNVLCNNGTLDVRIDSVVSLSDEFKVISVGSDSLDPLTCSSVGILFIPKQNGMRNGEVQFHTNLGIARVFVSGFALTPLLSALDVISMPPQPIGFRFDSTITNLYCLPSNLGQYTVRVELIEPDTVAFNLRTQEIRISPFNPCATLTSRFLPDRVGRRSALIKAEIQGAGQRQVYYSRLIGEGTCSKQTALQGVALPNTLVAGTNEIVTIPVRLPSSNSLFAEMRRPYSMTVSANNRLLFPAGSMPIGDNIADQRIITLTGRGFIAGDTLALLQFTTLWGDTTIARVSVMEFKWQDECQDTLRTSSTQIRITDYCNTTGAVRLFKNSQPLSITSIAPNPATTQATLRYSLRETGSTTLYITDVLGRVVQTLFSTEVEQGSYEQSVEFDDLPNGSYTITLITPTGTVSSPLRIYQ
jgi:hypothetical protein